MFARAGIAWSYACGRAFSECPEPRADVERVPHACFLVLRESRRRLGPEMKAVGFLKLL